jgi:hypothetical protein
MKRTLSTLFVALYAVVIVGITTMVHFCGNAVDSVDIFPVSSSQNSCCCGSTQHHSCCRTELHVLQIQDNQIAAASWVPAVVDMQHTVEYQPFALTRIDEQIGSVVLSDGSPPGSVPVYILHCTMLV